MAPHQLNHSAPIANSYNMNRGQPSVASLPTLVTRSRRPGRSWNN